MANKLILASVILAATILIFSSITFNEAEAKSKAHNKVDKFLRAETVGGDKMTDLCTVTIEVKNKPNATLKLKDCPKPEQPEVPDDNQTVPPVDNQTDNGTTTNPPQEQCGANEVWNAEEQSCVCKDGYTKNGSGACVIIPPVEQCPDGQFFNTTSQQCQLNPTQPPVDNGTTEPETPVNQTAGPVEVIMVGDVEGTAVLNAIKKENANITFGLGDLGYDKDLSWFKNNYGALGNQLACLVGNHEAAEDGSAALEKETIAYCGNDYTIEFNGALFVGLNTNGDLTKQKNDAVKLFSNQSFWEGISSVHIMSHKPICLVPPNQHHGVESSVKNALCEPLKAAIPDNVKLYFDSAHNHVMSAGEQNGITYTQSGAGGRSHYECGTNAAFPFCNDTKYGYLLYTIDPDGETTMQFKDTNGGIVK